MTDAELQQLYERAVDSRGDWADADWRNGCLRAMRKCIEASDIDKAVALLDADDWSNPVSCAIAFRGNREKISCPRCGGMGTLDSD